jgi:hypothetical protein
LGVKYFGKLKVGEFKLQTGTVKIIQVREY